MRIAPAPRLAVALSSVATLLLAAAPLAAQGGPYRILIPDFHPTEGADDDFGRDAAETLRDRLGELPTHRAVERDDIEDRLDDLDIDMDAVDCTRTRQLAGLMNTEVALCASYREEGESVAVDASFTDMRSGDSFDVPAFTVSRDAPEEAGDRIFEAFDRFVTLSNHVRYCAEYAQLEDYESALRNCNDALEMNPEALQTRYQRARVLYELGRLEEAYQELERVTEEDPVHEAGHRWAGYIAAQLGLEEEGREHYERFLELQPSATGVRRKVAFDLYDAGDPEGAMLVIGEGLGEDPDPGLLVDYGNYAFAAARQAADGDQGGGPDTATREALYRKAVDAYLQAYDSLGSEMGATQLRNTLSALVQLGEPGRAVEVGRTALDSHPDVAGLWSVYAEALRKTGELDTALDAMAQVEELDPAYPQLHQRWASWLLEAGRVDAAVERLRAAVGHGVNPDVAARMLFSHVYQNAVKPEEWRRAADGFELAKSFEAGSATRSMLNFWHGYSLYQLGIQVGAPETKESAREALPLFQEALELIRAGEAYAATDDNIVLSEFLQATQQYIDIQEALLKRGR